VNDPATPTVKRPVQLKTLSHHPKVLVSGEKPERNNLNASYKFITLTLFSRTKFTQ